MIFLRSLAFNIFFFVWISIMLLICMTVLPFHRYRMRALIRIWEYGQSAALRGIVGLKHRITGTEHLPDGPCILAVKHQSVWDTGIFYEIVPDPCYVLKKELMAIPVWGTSAAKCEMIAVDREAGAGALKAMVQAVTRALKEGRQVVIYPEGTRTTPGQKYPYHPGVAAIYAVAQKMDPPPPVLPVALNSGLFWGRHKFLKYGGTVALEIMPPMPDGMDRRSFMKELEERIETATNRLIAEARAANPDLPFSTSE